MGVVDAELLGEGGFDCGVEGGLGFRGGGGWFFPGLRSETLRQAQGGLWSTRSVDAGEGGVGVAGGFGLLEGHEAVALAGNDELGVIYEAHTVLGGEALGTGADEVDVGGFFEDEAGGLDGVAEPLDAGYAAGAEVGSVHEKGVELDAAVAGEEGASSSVEGVVVFHDGDGGLDGVDGGAAAGECGPAGCECGGDATLVGVDGVVGHGPGSAVDEEEGLAIHGRKSSSLRRSVSR